MKDTKVGKKPFIRALPTEYGGIQFRSRQEARWAVFFDTLGLHYEYEMEGFDLGDGVWYLPDFWIPSIDSWIEIKGLDPNAAEVDKSERLAVATGKNVFVFSGVVFVPDGCAHGPAAEACLVDIGEFAEPSHWWDENFCWCECLGCGLFGIQFEGRADRLPCVRSGDCCGSGKGGDWGHNADSPRLCHAFKQARTARFVR